MFKMSFFFGTPCIFNNLHDFWHVMHVLRMKNSLWSLFIEHNSSICMSIVHNTINNISTFRDAITW